jgi:hypothetical protein
MNLKNEYKKIEYIVCRPIQFSLGDYGENIEWFTGSLAVDKENLTIYVSDSQIFRIPIDEILGVEQERGDESTIHILYLDRGSLNRRILLAGPQNMIYRLYRILLNRLGPGGKVRVRDIEDILYPQTAGEDEARKRRGEKEVRI